jgi:hypothetical protein
MFASDFCVTTYGILSGIRVIADRAEGRDYPRIEGGVARRAEAVYDRQSSDSIDIVMPSRRPADE